MTEKVKEVWFDYGKDGVSFLFKNLSKDEREAIFKETRKESRPWLKRSDDETTEDEAKKNFEILIRSVIVDWKHLKNKHLARMLDPEDKWEYPGEKKANTIVVFNPENLKLLSQHCSASFVKYFNAGIEYMTILKQEEREKELKN